MGKKGQGSSLATALIQGVRYKWIALGAGVGYDAYSEWRAIPFFASVSMDVLSLRENAFYFQINGGYAKVWSPSFTDDQGYFYEGSNPSFNPVVGYRIATDKFDLYLSAGYKFQRLRYGWRWGGSPSQSLIQMDMERISIQLGFGF